jgi:hypothetical protein
MQGERRGRKEAQSGFGPRVRVLQAGPRPIDIATTETRLEEPLVDEFLYGPGEGTWSSFKLDSLRPLRAFASSASRLFRGLIFFGLASKECY